MNGVDEPVDVIPARGMPGTLPQYPGVAAACPCAASRLHLSSRLSWIVWTLPSPAVWSASILAGRCRRAPVRSAPTVLRRRCAARVARPRSRMSCCCPTRSTRPMKSLAAPAASSLALTRTTPGAGVTMAFLDSGFYPHPDLTRPEPHLVLCGCYRRATGRESQLQQAAYHQLARLDDLLCGSRQRLYVRAALPGHRQPGKPGAGQDRQPGGGIREADIQRALDWVLNNHSAFNIRIVNISLGGDHPANGKLSELDRLVEEAVGVGWWW